MGGHQGREGYDLLCMAIDEALKQQPVMPQMKVIWAVVKKEAHKEKEATAVPKALERAVADLWENGDRSVLGRYQRSWEYDKPAPKEFIRVVAQRLWDGEVAAEEKGGAVLMSNSGR